LSDYWNILKLFTGIKNVFLLEKYYMKFVSDLPEKYTFLPGGLFIAILYPQSSSKKNRKTLYR